MVKIKGITVKLIQLIETGRDEFNRPITEEIKIDIDNVLVAPASSTEVLDTLNLTGKKAIYTLGIPKNDDHDWEGAIVEFFGERFKVISIPLKGIDALIPLEWNSKVTVEIYSNGN